MQKRRFKWIAAACSLLLVASTGAVSASQMWNNIPVAGAYEVTLENEEQLQPVYTLGTSLKIPAGSIENVPATSYVVQFPSGKVSNTATIELTELGIYTITWYAIVEGKSVSASKTFKVTQDAYTIKGGVTMQEVTVNEAEGKTGLEKHPGKEGIKLTFDPESTFYYNKAVDLANLDGSFAHVYPFFGMTDLIGNLERYAEPGLTSTDKKRIAATFEYTDEARNYIITLTDCYDASNTVTIDLEWMEGKTRWNFSANPAGQAAHGLRGPVTKDKISQSSIKIDDSDNYYRVDMAPSEGHINANIVDAHTVTSDNGFKDQVCGGFELRYDVETNCVYITYTKATVSAAYSDEENPDKLVYTPKYTREEKVIADLDNESIYPKGKFKGFTTGEVYISFTAKTFTGNEANMEIASIGGVSGSEMLKAEEDDKEPVIYLTNEDMLKMNKIALNEEITIPDATALDLNLPYGTIADVAVYHLYDPSKTNVREPLTADNKFKPTKTGAYTVIYTATDRNGNVGEYPVTLQCLKGSNDKAVDMTVAEKMQVEAGSYFEIPAPTLNGLYKDLSAVKVSVIDENGNPVEVKDNKVFLGGVMDYTITYTYETPYKTYTASTVVTAESSNNVVLEAPVLPEYFIKGATYSLDDAIAYTFTAKGAANKADANVSIIAIQENGQPTETPVNIKAFTIPACKTLKLKYAYGEAVEYSEEIEVLDVGYDSADGKISMIDYFHDEKGVFEKNPTAMRYLTDGKAETKTATLKYINVLSLPKFKLDFQVESGSGDEKYNVPGAVVVTLIDYYDRNNKVQLRFTQNGEKAKVELDGQLMGNTTTNFIDAKTMISYSNGAFTVSGLKCPWSGSFTSAKILLHVELQGLTGRTSLKITGLSGKTFATGRHEKATPDVYVSESNIGYHQVGDVITIAKADVSDILSPYVESGLSVKVLAPDGSVVTSLDGVRLDGTCSASRVYQVKLQQVGAYSIQYTYKNQKNLENRYIGGPTVLNSVAPTLMVEGVTDGQQIKASVGDTIKTAPYSVSDDDTELKEVKHWCSVIYPSGVLKLVNSGASFEAKEKGLYTVLYVAYDETGNTSMFAYTVKVS